MSTETPSQQKTSAPDTDTAQPQAASPTEDPDPWLAEGLSSEESRNIMYAVAIAEWGFGNTDEVRTAIMESGKWSSISTIGDIADIAAYLQHQSLQKKAEADA